MSEQNRLNPIDIDIVIYHSPCPDGTGSAFVVWKYFKLLTESGEYENKDIIYHPANIGALPPDVTDKNVLICDYSYRKEILLELISKAKNLLIIDHHESAMKDLESIPDQYKIFDMNYSGVGLTWKYFFPNQPIPLLLEYIQDHDLWRKKLLLSDEFSSWFSTLKNTSTDIFQTYDEYLDNEKLMEKINTLGVPFLQYINHTVSEASKKFLIKFTEIRDKGKNKYYFIIYKNSTVHVSEIGNKLITNNPMADFAVVYYHNEHGNTLFSLRSDNQHVNVSDIARSFGGGGHRNASGCRSEHLVNVLKQPVSNNFDLYNKLFDAYYGKIRITNTSSDVDSGNFEIYNTSFDVIYLYTDQYKRKLGKYLLQTRHDNQQNAHICLKLSNERNNIKLVESFPSQSDEVTPSIKGEIPPSTYDKITLQIEENNLTIDRFFIAITWKFNPIKNSTNFVFTFHPDMNKNNIQMITKYYGLSEYSDIIIDGFHRIIPDQY